MGANETPATMAPLTGSSPWTLPPTAFQAYRWISNGNVILLDGLLSAPARDGPAWTRPGAWLYLDVIDQEGLDEYQCLYSESTAKLPVTNIARQEFTG
jgi:hypothetical protein